MKSNRQLKYSNYVACSQFRPTTVNNSGLTTILRKKTQGLYDYSTKMTREIILNLDVELPIIDGTTNHIDFDYMEAYISKLEQEHINELDTYLKVSGLNDCELTDEDKNILTSKIKTKTFLLGDLFESSTGNVDLQQKDLNGKGTYFINSGIENNGIKGKTDREARIFPTNTITIDFWGYAFYRDFEYKLATHNHVFSLSGDIIKNKEVGLYIAGQLSHLPTMFSYNNMATWTRLQSVEITLPVDDKGEIDYNYMKSYIKAIEKKVVADVVKYKDAVIATTKKVANE